MLLLHCSLQRAGVVAETVRQSVRDHRFVWEGTALSVGASIGVVELNAATESAAALLSAADVACYSAKDHGRNRVELYEEARGQDRHREMRWVAQITRAIEQARFDLFAQPVVPLRSADPSQPFFELTCRMRDEEGRVVLPVEFIPAAERYGVMPMVDRWVLQRAVAWLNKRSAAAQSLPLIAVNLSGTSLSDPPFLAHVLDVVGAPGIASALCFEVTETAAVANLESAAWFMTQLKERGCRFALDDFGSGLSSFRYLKKLPVDYLKIDGEFVARVADDAVDRGLVKAIVQVAHTLGIQTVAEKVETAAVRDALATLGVDHAQGFHVGRPTPLEGLAERLV